MGRPQRGAHWHLTRRGSLPEVGVDVRGVPSGEPAVGEANTGERHRGGGLHAFRCDRAMSVLLARMMCRIIPLQSRQTVISGPRSRSSWGELALCWNVRDRSRGGRRLVAGGGFSSDMRGGLHTEAA